MTQRERDTETEIKTKIQTDRQTDYQRKVDGEREYNNGMT